MSLSRPQSWSRRSRERLAGYLFLAPDALGLLLFVGIPMVLSLSLSLYSSNGFGGYRYVGLANYARLWSDPQFWDSLRVTLSYIGMLVPALYVSGLGLALLVRRTNLFNGVMRAMLFLPQMVSLVVVGLVWQMLAADKIGALPRALAGLGLGDVSLLGDPAYALISVTVVSVWFLAGFYMLIFLGGLQDIPQMYYDAARIDGAGPVTRFWFVTLPMLKPTSLFVLMTSLVASVAGAQTFDLIWVMTQGGPADSTSLTILYIYEQAFQFGAFGYAGAMASVLVAVLLLVTVMLFLATAGGRVKGVT
ncbi:MAG: sugar ABC transporter permease [Pseudomonadota bacterium]